MGSGVEGITQSGVSTPKALPKIPVLIIHSLPTIHCYYYLDISSNIPALSGLYVLRSRFLKALTLSIFPYHVLSTHWWICSMHTLLGDGWIAIATGGTLSPQRSMGICGKKFKQALLHYCWQIILSTIILYI